MHLCVCLVNLESLLIPQCAEANLLFEAVFVWRLLTAVDLPTADGLKNNSIPYFERKKNTFSSPSSKHVNVFRPLPPHVCNYHTVCSPPLQADSQVETLRQHFQEESLEYVCKLQEIQERKKFECVEPVSGWPKRHKYIHVVVWISIAVIPNKWNWKMKLSRICTWLLHLIKTSFHHQLQSNTLKIIRQSGSVNELPTTNTCCQQPQNKAFGHSLSEQTTAEQTWHVIHICLLLFPPHPALIKFSYITGWQTTNWCIYLY